jgi:hypothetical protein
MLFESLVDLHCVDQSAISYKITIDDLRMVVLINGEDIPLFEIIFAGVQSHAFVPDDLSNYRAHIELDSLQRAIGKHWIDELRVPSDVHRKYLEGHEFYVLHVSDIGQFEVVALSAQFNDLGKPD